MFDLNLATNQQTWNLQSSGMWCRVFWGTGDDVSHYNWRNPRKIRGSFRSAGRILSFDFATFLRADSTGLLISSRFRLRLQATVACPRSGQVPSKFSKYEVAPYQLNLSRTCCSVLYCWVLISFPNIYVLFPMKNGIQKYLKPRLQALQNTERHKKTGTFEKPNKNWRNPRKKIYWQKLNHYNLPFKRQ